MSDQSQPETPAAPLPEDQALERLDHQQLIAAFKEFNAMSEQLSAAYAELEQQVVELTEALQHSNEQREQELGEKERVTQRLESLINLLPAGILVLDNRGRIVDANPAAIELLGEPLTGELWLKVIDRCFAPRADDGHEVSLKSGRRVSLATRSLQGEPGQIVMLTDQTETRALQSRLSHMHRLSSMGRMMASLAHQIRTPLSAAMLYSSHLSNEGLTDEQRRRFASKVKGRLTSLEQQVRDMLIFARGETKLTDLVSTEQLFAAIEDALDIPLANADSDAECRNGTPAVFLQCNQEALVGALMNLVNNSLQAAGEGTELLICTEFMDDRALLLAVQDQGPGLTPEQLAQVKEPFYTTKSQGTGLGLAVAQVMARAHHGEFIFESAPGKGTLAGFRLPFLRDPGEAGTTHTEQRLPPGAAGMQGGVDHE